MAPSESITAIVRTLLSEPGLLAEMAASRHGSLVVKSVLDQSEESDREEVVNQLRKDIAFLRSVKSGRTKQLLRIVTPS